jgi:23S rRNA (uracil1939-C5)-methyltransferase
MGNLETVTITALGNEGQGVGDLPSGKKIFVPAVLPGETCEVEVTSETSKFAEGICYNLLNVSPDRILSYGNFVPGADLAHLSYKAALEYKEDKVRNCLIRLGRLPADIVNAAMKQILPCVNPLNYRNHMQYRLVGGKLCLINSFTKMAEDPGNPILEYDIFTKLRTSFEQVFYNAPTNLFEEIVMRASERTKDVMLELVSGNNSAHEVIIGYTNNYIEVTSLVHHLQQTCKENGFKLAGLTLRISSTPTDRRTRGGKRVLLYGNDYYEEILLGHKFRIHAGAFFQVNIPQAELLYKSAIKFTRDDASLLDLYCGTGSIGLSLLQPGQKLVGLDTVPEAIRAAKENALLNGISNAVFSVKPAESIDFSTLSLPTPMSVIVDPPRKGLDMLLVKKLLAVQPSKICYISCDPATMSRDLSHLVGTGVYHLDSVRPVDMFPWTHHVETCVLLSKLSEAPKLEVRVKMSDLDLTEAEAKATYEEIKDYVLNQTGLLVSNLNIAQVKRKYGIIERSNYNLPKSEDSRQPNTPPEKEIAIVDALRHFKMIQ